MFSQGLALLTVICAIQSWRATSNRLLTILKHNIFYYACEQYVPPIQVLLAFPLTTPSNTL